MPKSRVAALPSRATPRPHSAQASLTGGNGTLIRETDAEHFARLEALMERMQHTLDVQFQRIAEIQVMLDRLAPPRDE
jgi:hypothetical protein